MSPKPKHDVVITFSLASSRLIQFEAANTAVLEDAAAYGDVAETVLGYELRVSRLYQFSDVRRWLKNWRPEKRPKRPDSRLMRELICSLEEALGHVDDADPDQVGRWRATAEAARTAVEEGSGG